VGEWSRGKPFITSQLHHFSTFFEWGSGAVMKWGRGVALLNFSTSSLLNFFLSGGVEQG